METYFQTLLTQGGPLGAVVVVIVLLLGLWLRHKGWLFDSPKGAPSPEAARISDLGVQIDDVQKRLTSVEQDLRHLPTRAEITALNVSQAQLSERLMALDRTAVATGRAVTRIEDFLIQATKRS